MRRFGLIAILLLLIPAAVALRQYWATYRDVGAPANYLEIEEPPALGAGGGGFADSGIPILCYHYIGDRPSLEFLGRVLGSVLFNLPLLEGREYWTLKQELFARHMEWLADEGYETLFLDELMAIQRGQRAAPERAVCITFDDGDRSVLELALPILQKHGHKATLFVITELPAAGVGRYREVQPMSWEELAQLRDSALVRLESHTDAMHYKVKSHRGTMRPVFLHAVPEDGGNREGRQMVLEDLQRSRQRMREHLGVEARFLAWPYGFANDALDSLAAGAGFSGSLSLQSGTNPLAAGSPWQMPRLTISARTTLRVLREQLEGADLERPRISSHPLAQELQESQLMTPAE